MTATTVRSLIFVLNHYFLLLEMWSKLLPSSAAGDLYLNATTICRRIFVLNHYTTFCSWRFGVNCNHHLLLQLNHYHILQLYISTKVLQPSARGDLYWTVELQPSSVALYLYQTITIFCIDSERFAVNCYHRVIELHRPSVAGDLYLTITTFSAARDFY